MQHRGGCDGLHAARKTLLELIEGVSFESEDQAWLRAELTDSQGDRGPQSFRYLCRALAQSSRQHEHGIQTAHLGEDRDRDQKRFCNIRRRATPPARPDTTHCPAYRMPDDARYENFAEAPQH